MIIMAAVRPNEFLVTGGIEMFKGPLLGDQMKANLDDIICGGRLCDGEGV